MTPVRFTSNAERDVAEAFAWYEEKREGLGSEFLSRVDEVVEKITHHPLSYPKVIEDVRRANLEQFPYALWYKIEDDAVVIACIHGKRSPRVALARALGVIEMKKPEP